MRNQAWHSLKNITILSQSEFSWTHQSNCSSCAARAFSKQNRLICFLNTCMFGRINELLIISIFQDNILLIFIIMKKTGPGKQVQIFEVWEIEVRLYCSCPLFCNIKLHYTHFPRLCSKKSWRGPGAVLWTWTCEIEGAQHRIFMN